MSQRRNYVISIRLTKDEKESIEQKTKTLGFISASHLIRDRVINDHFHLEKKINVMYAQAKNSIQKVKI